MKKSAKKALPADKHVGARVRTRRMILGMTQSELGDACELTFQQIQKYEKGTNRIGSSRLMQIAAALGVPIAHFFEGLDEQTKPRGTEADLNLINTFMATRDGVRLARSIVRMPQAIRTRFVELAEQLVGEAPALLGPSPIRAMA
jgi:transcriptional regulator with XRE-family HTH domain